MDSKKIFAPETSTPDFQDLDTNAIIDKWRLRFRNENLQEKYTRRQDKESLVFFKVFMYFTVLIQVMQLIQNFIIQWRQNTYTRSAGILISAFFTVIGVKFERTAPYCAYFNALAIQILQQIAIRRNQRYMWQYQAISVQNQQYMISGALVAIYLGFALVAWHGPIYRGLTTLSMFVVFIAFNWDVLGVSMVQLIVLFTMIVLAMYFIKIAVMKSYYVEYLQSRYLKQYEELLRTKATVGMVIVQSQPGANERYADGKKQDVEHRGTPSDCAQLQYPLANDTFLRMFNLKQIKTKPALFCSLDSTLARIEVTFEATLTPELRRLGSQFASSDVYTVKQNLSAIVFDALRGNELREILASSLEPRGEKMIKSQSMNFLSKDFPSGDDDEINEVIDTAKVYYQAQYQDSPSSHPKYFDVHIVKLLWQDKPSVMVMVSETTAKVQVKMQRETDLYMERVLNSISDGIRAPLNGLSQLFTAAQRSRGATRRTHPYQMLACETLRAQISDVRDHYQLRMKSFRENKAPCDLASALRTTVRHLCVLAEGTGATFALQYDSQHSKVNTDCERVCRVVFHFATLALRLSTRTRDVTESAATAAPTITVKIDDAEELQQQVVRVTVEENVSRMTQDECRDILRHLWSLGSRSVEGMSRNYVSEVEYYSLFVSMQILAHLGPGGYFTFEACNAPNGGTRCTFLLHNWPQANLRGATNKGYFDSSQTFVADANVTQQITPSHGSGGGGGIDDDARGVLFSRALQQRIRDKSTSDNYPSGNNLHQAHMPPPPPPQQQQQITLNVPQNVQNKSSQVSRLRSASNGQRTVFNAVSRRVQQSSSNAVGGSAVDAKSNLSEEDDEYEQESLQEGGDAHSRPVKTGQNFKLIHSIFMDNANSGVNASPGNALDRRPIMSATSGELNSSAQGAPKLLGAHMEDSVENSACGIKSVCLVTSMLSGAQYAFDADAKRHRVLILDPSVYTRAALRVTLENLCPYANFLDAIDVRAAVKHLARVAIPQNLLTAANVARNRCVTSGSRHTICTSACSGALNAYEFVFVDSDSFSDRGVQTVKDLRESLVQHGLADGCVLVVLRSNGKHDPLPHVFVESGADVVLSKPLQEKAMQHLFDRVYLHAV